MKFSNEKSIISKFNIWDGLKVGHPMNVSVVNDKYSIYFELWEAGLIEKLFYSEKEYDDWKHGIATGSDYGLAHWYLKSFEQNISETFLQSLIGKNVYLHYAPTSELGHELDPDIEAIGVIGYKKEVRLCSDGTLAYRYSLRSNCEYDNDILIGTNIEVVKD